METLRRTLSTGSTGMGYKNIEPISADSLPFSRKAMECDVPASLSVSRKDIKSVAPAIIHFSRSDKEIVTPDPVLFETKRKRRFMSTKLWLLALLAVLLFIILFILTGTNLYLNLRNKSSTRPKPLKDIKSQLGYLQMLVKKAESESEEKIMKVTEELHPVFVKISDSLSLNEESIKQAKLEMSDIVQKIQQLEDQAKSA